MKQVLYFINAVAHIFGATTVSIFQNFGKKVELLVLLAFPTTYAAQQDFTKVLHKHMVIL